MATNMLKLDKKNVQDPNEIVRAPFVTSDDKAVTVFSSTTTWTPDEGESVDVDSLFIAVNYLGVIYAISGAKLEQSSPSDDALHHLGDATGAATTKRRLFRKAVVEEAGEQKEVITGDLSKVDDEVIALVKIDMTNGDKTLKNLANARYLLTAAVEGGTTEEDRVRFSLPINKNRKAVVPYVLRRSAAGAPWEFERRATENDFVDVDTSSPKARKDSLHAIAMQYVNRPTI